MAGSATKGRACVIAPFLCYMVLMNNISHKVQKEKENHQNSEAIISISKTEHTHCYLCSTCSEIGIRAALFNGLICIIVLYIFAVCDKLTNLMANINGSEQMDCYLSLGA